MSRQPCPLAPLLRYKAWADDVLYAALAAVSAEQLAAPTRIFAGSILRTLNHVLLIDEVWKAHLMGMPHHYTTRNPEATPPFAELHRRQAGTDAWYVAYATTLLPAAGDESIGFTFIGGGEGRLTRCEILQHVVNHTTYHRGHLTAILWQAGISPPTTDLPVFQRETAGAG